MSKKVTALLKRTDLSDAILDSADYDGMETDAIISDQLQGGAGCPVCGHSEFRNIHKERWGVCSEHLTQWPLGFDCSSSCSYHNESPAMWEQNMLTLSSYKEVTPVAHISRTKRNRASR